MAKLQDVKDTFQDQAEEARDQASRWARKMRRKGGDYLEDASDWAREHPGEAVGVALLVGAIVGSLIGWRRRPRSAASRARAFGRAGAEALGDLRDQFENTLGDFRGMVDKIRSKLS